GGPLLFAASAIWMREVIIVTVNITKEEKYEKGM
ncbi:hypothetical protein C5S35_00905, partial [Candidatus Methanophagaceae archaeon]